MALDEFTTRALDEGRLDDAIRHMSTVRGNHEDVRFLAHLLGQRGRFQQAEALLRSDLAAGTDSPDDLRERGNAAWRADHLGAALVDLKMALSREHDLAQAQQIRGDITILEDELRSLRVLDAAMTRLDGSVVVVLALLISLFLWFAKGRSGRGAREEAR